MTLPERHFQSIPGRTEQFAVFCLRVSVPGAIVLNADELGEKGEARFKELCADAKLICNKSDRDRSGWDFLVEFPFATSNQHSSLEARPPALSCHVQVKTIRADNDRIKLRLSAAERLAKELKPAFIYVLRVNDALQFVDAYLIHILNDPLAHILKRLREATRSGDSAGNKRTISMKPTALGTLIVPTGEALAAALAQACAAGMFGYGRQKEQQLSTLGFGRVPLVLEMHLQPPKLRDLVDASLGLRADVRVEALRATETRFGISLPVIDHKGPITLPFPIPDPIDKCTITARSDRISKAIAFKADMYLPRIMNLPKEDFKARLSTPFFTLFVYDDHYTFQTHVIEEATPSQWLTFFEFAQLYANGRGIIELSPTHFRTLTINLDEIWFGRPRTNQQPVIDVLHHLVEIMNIVGVTEEPSISLATITNESGKIASAHLLLHSKPDQAPFEIADIDDDWNASNDGYVLVVSYIRLRDILVCYFASAYLARNAQTGAWLQEKVTLLGMEKVRATSSDYENFVEAAKKRTIWQDAIITPLE